MNPRPGATAGAERPYDHAVEAGIFGAGGRIEPIEGELVTRTPQGNRHAAVATRVATSLGAAVGGGCHVRTQMPLAAGADSEPEPDVAVVDGSDLTTSMRIQQRRGWWRRCRTSPWHDHSVKQPLYARCGIPEYWIVALPDGRLEVYRDPAGDGYRTVQIPRRR